MSTDTPQPPYTLREAPSEYISDARKIFPQLYVTNYLVEAGEGGGTGILVSDLRTQAYYMAQGDDLILLDYKEMNSLMVRAALAWARSVRPLKVDIRPDEFTSLGTWEAHIRND